MISAELARNMAVRDYLNKFETAVRHTAANGGLHVLLEARNMVEYELFKQLAVDNGYTLTETNPKKGQLRIWW